MGLRDSYETILVDRSEGVLRLTLNRPEKLNSFTNKMHEEVRAVFDHVAEAPEIRCLLLTGAGRGFCTGQDLSDRKFDATDPNATPPDLRASLDERYNPLIRRIAGMEKPVVCAVNGAAAGAGANLALACDIVIAAESAKFIQSFSKIGLVPDSGGTWSLPRLVGMARAKGLALLGDAIDARMAADWGLIWRAVADADLMTEADAIAHRLAAGPTRGLGLIKQAMARGLDNDLSSQLDLERDFQEIASHTEDYREGVAAFMEKRKPAFKGR